VFVRLTPINSEVHRTMVLLGLNPRVECKCALGAPLKAVFTNLEQYLARCPGPEQIIGAGNELVLAPGPPNMQREGAQAQGEGRPLGDNRRGHKVTTAWTAASCGNATVKELFLVQKQPLHLYLYYFWVNVNTASKQHRRDEKTDEDDDRFESEEYDKLIQFLANIVGGVLQLRKKSRKSKLPSKRREPEPEPPPDCNPEVDLDPDPDPDPDPDAEAEDDPSSNPNAIPNLPRPNPNPNPHLQPTPTLTQVQHHHNHDQEQEQQQERRRHLDADAKQHQREDEKPQQVPGQKRNQTLTPTLTHTLTPTLTPTLTRDQDAMSDIKEKKDKDKDKDRERGGGTTNPGKDAGNEANREEREKRSRESGKESKPVSDFKSNPSNRSNSGLRKEPDDIDMSQPFKEMFNKSKQHKGKSDSMLSCHDILGRNGQDSGRMKDLADDGQKPEKEKEDRSRRSDLEGPMGQQSRNGSENSLEMRQPLVGRGTNSLGYLGFQQSIFANSNQRSIIEPERLEYNPQLNYFHTLERPLVSQPFLGGQDSNLAASRLIAPSRLMDPVKAVSNAAVLKDVNPVRLEALPHPNDAFQFQTPTQTCQQVNAPQSPPKCYAGPSNQALEVKLQGAKQEQEQEQEHNHEHEHEQTKGMS
jgi:hypothetical protein